MCREREIMKNYRFLIQYDGTRYEGWQRQKEAARTIQGKLEEVLSGITGHPETITGAGRTDAGVHAAGQVANAHLNIPFSAEELAARMNELLPDDIAILSAEMVDDRFHSRFSSGQKVYRYRIRTGPRKNVFERRQIWQYGRKLDLRAMKAAARKLEGTHDFRSFCNNKKMKKSAVRTLTEIRITEKDDEMNLIYRGNGFLQGMVRVLTGTLVEVGEGKRDPSDMGSIFLAENRQEAGFTAPPQGLILESIEYPENADTPETKALKNGKPGR